MRTAKQTFLEDHGKPKSFWREILKEWFPERDAEIFDRAFLENVPYEQVAVEFGLQPRQCKKIALSIEKRIEKIAL